ncbi:homeobox protein CDX-1 isoform X2 [Sminthopsis crassicaudata]|uniref:homeobox protein CDX-1 isoform X2 n=1 Tax=Sminthopsis crassicaudata TaxID=9301 RepID=UPI003D684A7C
MYVGYLLEKDANMYPSPVRHPGLNLSPQSYVPSAPPNQYSDFASYQHVQGINNDPSQGLAGAAWSSPYPPAKDDWTAYGPGPTVPAASPAQISYSPADFGAVQAPPGSGLGLLPASLSTPGVPLSPGGQRRTPYEWMRRSGSAGHSSGKTRTKDKYRVVYTDHQRLELEKEFHYSRYITIRRKAELAVSLGLTERQVKIWFQNRRAKERKANKKKMQQQQQQSQPNSTTSTPTPGLGPLPPNTPMGSLCTSTTGLLSSSPLTIKEEYLS